MKNPAGWNLEPGSGFEIRLPMKPPTNEPTMPRISRTSVWLLAPYLAWVSFATALTFALFRLNG